MKLPATSSADATRPAPRSAPSPAKTTSHLPRLEAASISWLSKLDKEPISTTSLTGAIVIVSSQDIRELLGAALYRPRDSFATFSKAVDDAMAGDTAAIVSSLFRRHIPHLRDVCATDNSTGPSSEDYFQEGAASVLCADGDPVSGYDVAWWKRYIDHQVNTSSIFGAYWSNV